MSLFDCLPDEIINLVLVTKILSYKELCYFGQCCKRFYCLTKDDNLWKQKANERWRFWHKKFQKCHCWQIVYQRRHQVEMFVKQHLYLLEEQCSLQSPISEKDFGFLDTCLDTFGGDSYLYLNDVLRTILYGTESSKDLTQKYFAEKAKIALTHIICRTDLHTYLENPERTEQLEEGATIIARWMCPLSDISFEDICKNLEDITNMVRAGLGPGEQNITNRTDKNIQLKVLKALQEVFYERLKFHGDKENYYRLSNSYINEVLETKCGIPISLSILFQSIAKRLGLCIEPVNCPGHFLVRWKYFDASVNEIKYCHIDCFNQGVFINQTQLPHSLSTGPVPAPREVLKRMMLNIIHILQSEVERTQLHESIVSLSHALDLFMILLPDHLEMTRLNARIKLYLRVQLDEVIKSLEDLIAKQSVSHFEDKRLLEVAKQQDETLKSTKRKTLKKKLRSNPKNTKVELKVGTIMHHRRFNYSCVVYGWDRVCKMPYEWIAQMGVDNLSNGRNQPFYNVLVNDGSERYASQESLIPEPQKMVITHPSIGLFFKEFTGDQYVPNNQLQNLYPEDWP